MKALETISEVIGWIKLVISPMAAGILIGWIIYLNLPTTFGILLGVILTIIGLILGILWANKAWKGKGTIWTASRHMHSPELDNNEEKDQK